ncbi:unnamed protein product [Vitrella brassicaformis CCMP3155]|uniref:Uncharacterized protein n=1 Tax=Vitrella brassicaformis (strain CCMP3155) TaxID=1169540 RepID=A0A0G4EEV3_VITBC|nr:unnamed protein product [Vitrella brassicaformis CCMP3155]|eukprot:CEL93903.1 unnamed protein product [Vitrella brassicaformis CCMP3155]
MSSHRNTDSLADLRRSTNLGSTATRFGFPPFGSTNRDPPTPPTVPGCGTCQHIRFINNPLNPFRVGYKKDGRFIGCVAMTPGIESAITSGTKQFKLVDNDYVPLVDELTKPGMLIGLQHHEAGVRGLSSDILLLSAIMVKKLCNKHGYDTPLSRGAGDAAAADRYIHNPMNRADVRNPLANDLTAATHCLAKISDFICDHDGNTPIELMNALPRLLQDFATQPGPSSSRRRKTSSNAAAAAASPADDEDSIHAEQDDFFNANDMEQDNKDDDFDMYDDDAAIARRDVIPMVRFKTLIGLQTHLSDIPDDIQQFMGAVVTPTAAIVQLGGLLNSDDCVIDAPNVIDDFTLQQAAFFANHIASMLPPAKASRAKTAQELLSWGKRIDANVHLSVKQVINYVAIKYAISLRAKGPSNASQGSSQGSSVNTRGRASTKKTD